MPFRKMLLLSAAIPFVALPFTPQSQAATARHYDTTGTLVVAQSDAAGAQGEDAAKKKRQHGNGKDGKDQKSHKPAQASDQSHGSPGAQKPKQNGDHSAGNGQKKHSAQQEKNAPAKAGAAHTDQQSAQTPKRKPDNGQADHAQKGRSAAPAGNHGSGGGQKQAEKPAGSSKSPAKAEVQAPKANDHVRKPRHGENAKQKPEQPAKQQNAAKPEQPAKQQNTAKPEQPAKQQNAAKPEQSTKDKNAARSQQPAGHDNAAKSQPSKVEGAGTAAPQKPTNQAVAPKTQQPSQPNAGQAVQSSESGSKNVGNRKPIPEQPANNAARTAGEGGGKPERFKGTNGAPVLDSAKEPAPANRQMNGRTAVQGQATAGARTGNAPASRENSNPVQIQSAEKMQGKPMKEPPKFRLPQDVRVEKQTDNRVILNFGNRTVIENNDYGRIAHDARDVRYETLSDGNTRQVVVRPNGVRVITIRNEYGDVIHRSRIDRNGQEITLIYAPQGDRRDRAFYRDPTVDLPPIRLNEPVDDYVLEGGRADERQYVTFLEKPPIERVPHVYTLDQVRYSARLRDMMPRIDLDTITFSSGSSDIGREQAQTLQTLADAIQSVLRRDPGQIFLIEGHTDAVGSAQSNLLLSDQRAELVASVLTQDFDVPPENLVTQGYGEQYLKIDTQGPERANRRVTVRRITPLVRPTAQR